MTTFNKPAAGDSDWAGEINQNWTDLENAITYGIGLTTGASTPSQITSDQNDYAFAGGTSSYIFQRLSSDASRSITGIAGGGDGKHLILANVGSSEIVLANENAGSSAANRIITGTGQNLTLAPNVVARLVYDATTQRWRVQASQGIVASGLVASGAVQGYFGSTRNIASGTVGAFDLGSGAVIAGTVGSGAIQSASIASGQVGYPHLADAAVQSGSIASGQVGPFHLGSGAVLSGHIGSGQLGQFHVASGAVTSGRLGVAGIPDGTQFLRDDFTWQPTAGGGLTSGSVKSGHVASGAIQGYYGATRHIASGTVGRFDMASGSIGPWTNENAQALSMFDDQAYIGISMSLTAGARSGGATCSYVAQTFIAGETISGQVHAVCFASGGTGLAGNGYRILRALPATSGRMPAIGIVLRDYKSGEPVRVEFAGWRPYHGNNMPGIGPTADGPIFVGNSGELTTNPPTMSGSFVQQIGWFPPRGPAGTEAFTFNLLTPPYSGDVQSFRLAQNSVTSFSISGGSVLGNYHLASGTVYDSAIRSGGLGSGSIASGQIGDVHLASGLAVQRLSLRPVTVFGPAWPGAVADIFGPGVLGAYTNSGNVQAGNFYSGATPFLGLQDLGSNAGSGQSIGLSVLGTSPPGAAFSGYANAPVGKKLFAGMISGYGAMVVTDPPILFFSGSIPRAIVVGVKARSGSINLVQPSLPNDGENYEGFAGSRDTLGLQTFAPFDIPAQRAVTISSGGLLRTCLPALSGFRYAVGVSQSGILSGQNGLVYTRGPMRWGLHSGHDIAHMGRRISIGTSGQIGIMSAGLLSAGVLSGGIYQFMGFICGSGAIFLEPEQDVRSGFTINDLQTIV